jgi:hypothetical protein
LYLKYFNALRAILQNLVHFSLGVARGLAEIRPFRLECFEPPPLHPRLMGTPTIDRPAILRPDTYKSGGAGQSQGEVRHACTKRTLARLRPHRAGRSGRGYRRAGLAGAEHLNNPSRGAGLNRRAAVPPNHPCCVSRPPFGGRRYFASERQRHAPARLAPVPVLFADQAFLSDAAPCRRGSSRGRPRHKCRSRCR